MKKLRIGIILNENYHPTVGGGFSYYERLVELIDNYAFDEKLEFLFINIGFEKEFPLRKRVVQVNPFREFSRKEKLICKLQKVANAPLLRTILLGKLSKMHAHTYERKVEKKLQEEEIHLLYYLTPAINELNFPFVMTHWDNGHMSVFPFPEVSMNGIFEIRERQVVTLRKAFAVFVESQAGKKELLSYVNINPERVFTVPLFPGKAVDVQLEFTTEQQILRKHTLQEYGYFFYPAQFWSHKNHSALLFAFRQLLQTYPQIKLLLTGSDKGNLSYIKSLIEELEIEYAVEIPGFVSNEEIYVFYKYAIALTMPTFLGPTNMPLLEAAELGCPVVCSDFEGHREQLQGQAWFINPRSSEHIYEGLLKALENPLNRNIFRNAKFSSTAALESIETNFLQLLPIRKAFGQNFLQF